MAHIVLIGCSKRKAEQCCEAQDLYQGALFKKQLEYAKRLKPDRIFILSAKHHVVELDQKLCPYNETLNNKSAQERREWAAEVLKQLKEKGVDVEHDCFTILAGKNYYSNLTGEMKCDDIPCKGMPIGKCMQTLDKLINP